MNQDRLAEDMQSLIGLMTMFNPAAE